MKRISIIAYAAFLVIIVANIAFYISLYNNQINYSAGMLEKQVSVVASDIENTSRYIVRDLNEVDFSDEITLFFTDAGVNQRSKEMIRLYYSKYADIIVGLMMYNTDGDVYTLFRDDEQNSWLDGSYRAQNMPQIYDKEYLEKDRDKYKYYIPVISEGRTVGNVVLTVDLSRYFSRVFSRYNTEQYQWQWVVNDSGSVVFDNHQGEIEYGELRKITQDLAGSRSGRIVHNARTGNSSGGIISAFTPAGLLGMNFGLVFSAPTDYFRSYIIRNGVTMGAATMLVILFIITLFRSFFKRQKKQFNEVRDSETTLVSIIDQMPVGIIVYNGSREILRANRQAASLFSYDSEELMTGKLIPDLSRNAYISELSERFGQGKIIKITSHAGEKILFRNYIPVTFRGESATMEVFIDVTALETARKQEAEANIAKSELLARMSFEIRTPLNGIVGMTEMLTRSELPEEYKEIVRLLRRSADLLVTIINDIFDVSKVEAGKMILDDIPFGLREEINYCINLVRRENPDTFVRLTSSVEKDVPEHLIGDPYRLRQIITNLFYNALSGTQTGEVILHCSVAGSDGNRFTLGFSITDSGRVYTRAELKKLFGDYITSRNERADWAEDLKLGPILARQLTELMGGTLVAESPASRDQSGHEKGLKVSFTVRLHLNEKIKKSIDLSGYTRVSDLRTLVITGPQGRDDDFLSVLHRTGLPVSVTSFQKQTVSQIRNSLGNPAGRYILLVIFDEQEADGFEAGRALQDAGLSDEFIILMFTSRDPRGHYPRCVDMSIDHLLVKPFAVEDLLNVLRDHFPNLRVNQGTAEETTGAVPLVLVVDDNFLNRKVVGSLLKALGVRAEYAAGGEEAVAMARETRYDMILMDLIMPEIDGFEAATSILGFDPASVIVALSADTMPETKARVEETGMKELLAKPATVEDLRRVLEKYNKLR